MVNAIRVIAKELTKFPLLKGTPLKSSPHIQATFGRMLLPYYFWSLSKFPKFSEFSKSHLEETQLSVCVWSLPPCNWCPKVHRKYPRHHYDDPQSPWPHSNFTGLSKLVKLDPCDSIYVDTIYSCVISHYLIN